MFSGVLLGAPETEVVLEEFLTGEEVSFFALCDGKRRHPDRRRPGPQARRRRRHRPQHRRHGSLLHRRPRSPPPCASGSPTTSRKRPSTAWPPKARPSKESSSSALMMTPRGPMVLEFNTRWGDPETEAIVLRLETDILDLFNASIDGTAETLVVRMQARSLRHRHRRQRRLSRQVRLRKTHHRPRRSRRQT